MKRLVLLSCAAALATFGYACSDDDTTANPVPTDGGAGSDTGGGGDGGGGGEGGGGGDGGGGTEAGTDSGPPLPCTAAELDLPANDYTSGDAGDGGAVTVTFPTATAAAQYTNRCVKIKAGQSVTFTGEFPNHPLQSFAGDTPSPIPAITDNVPSGSLTITFPNAGSFGYRCQAHPLVMNGAVKVVP